MDRVKFLRRRAQFYIDMANQAVRRDVFQKLFSMAEQCEREAVERERALGLMPADEGPRTRRAGHE